MRLQTNDSQVRVPAAGLLDLVRLQFGVGDAEQGVGVAGERRPAGQQDQIERSVLVLVGELDGSLALTHAGVVVTPHRAVSRRINK